LLPLAILLNGVWVLFAVPPPVIRIPSSPLLRAIQAHLAVLRVRRDPLAVIVSAAAALAAGVAAHRLPRLIFGRLENPLTVAASPFDHTGVVAPGGA
jgi:hypothetical protein